MNQWVSIVAMVGWLALALSAYRGAKKTIVLALAWIAIFLLIAAVFAAVSPGGRP